MSAALARGIDKSLFCRNSALGTQPRPAESAGRRRLVQMGKYLMMRVSGAAGFAALVLLGAGAQAPAQAPAPLALASLETGLWEFTDVGKTNPPTRACVTDLRQLFQPRAPMPLCKHFIAENEADHTAVAYDCAAAGQGRTTLRVETARLIQLDSQGVAGGRPFSMRIEARRVGACTAASR